MASIQCGNCAGVHASVAEVRACHRDRATSGAAPVSRAAAPDQATASDASGRGGASTTREVRAPGDAWAGPDELARWLVVGPGTNVPDAWEHAEHIKVDDRAIADAEALADELALRFGRRERLVVELEPGLDLAAGAEPRLPWVLDPTFTFASERVWHLLWANSVDLRDPDRPRWHWAEQAIAAGARSIDAAATAGAVAGDVLGPDGSPLWCDGGPIGPEPALARPVVHRVAIERGSLSPLRRGTCTADLAPDQLAAVVHGGVAARIIAPAGSGKTRVLTERARHLLRNWGVPPSALTLVAFNVRAADEMRERTADLPGLQVRTLNSLALAIVNGSGRFAGRERTVTTIDEREVRRILDSLVTFPRRANTDPAATWLEAMSMVRLALVEPGEVERRFDGEVPGFVEVFERYRAVLRDRGLVDFDEQIVAATTTLLAEPAVRATAQRAARLLLVDEFQDLAPAHLLLLRLLASPELAVFAVGDDDQTIYGHAGATPEWLIGFDRLFPGSGDHPLEVNYRCPPAVVRAAATLLGHNRRRVAKVIRSPAGRDDGTDAGADSALAGADARDAGAGSLVIVADDDTVGATTAAVARALDPARVPQLAPIDVAVLTRVNASLAAVQVSLRHHGIAVRAAVGPSYLERTGVRVALAWLRIATAPDKLRAADIGAAVRRPSRGLSPRVVDWVSECRDRSALGRLAGRLTDDRDASKVEGFLADVQLVASGAARGGTTADLLDLVRRRVGLDDALAKLDRSRGDAQATHGDDVDALWALARLHPDPVTFAGWLRDELAAPSDPAGVTLATIHRVKGQEWPYVVVHDVRDGLVPHRLADDRAEERRVFHVGITRCSQQVVVVTDAARSSPFLPELVTPASARRAVIESPTPGRGSRSRAPAADPAGVALREALKQWRLERARADGVPAYVVFTNVTLDALVEQAPTTVDALRAIPGIGPAKRERYGAEIAAVVAAVAAAPTTRGSIAR